MITFTNIEQTERLRKLGLLPTTYNEYYDGVWTLDDLLDLMPKKLEYYEMRYEYPPFQDDWEVWMRDYPYDINGELKLQCNEDNKWFVDYDFDGFLGRLPQSESLIEALVLAIELLAANGYDF